MNIKAVHVKNLKKKRKELGLTQKDVASKAEISESSYKSIETERSTSNYEVLKRIANILELDIFEVIKRNTKVLTFALHKGGCGKTTVASNVIQILANRGYKILAVDADPQKHLNKSFDMSTNEEKNLYKIFSEEDSTIKENIVFSNNKNIDFLLAHHELTMGEIIIASAYQRETIFKRKLQPIVEEGVYDFIIIDTNPSLNFYNFNFLVSADRVIIPLEATPFGVEGLSTFMKFFKQVKYSNPSVDILGIIFTQIDSRESIGSIMIDQVVETFDDVHIFKSIVPRDTNNTKAQGLNTTIVSYAPESRASLSLQKIVDEILSLLEKKEE